MRATLDPGARHAERVRSVFDATREQGRAALIIYLPAGFPDMDTSEACLRAAAEAGADLLEVGFPFSDPMMDGPTIQAASQTALDHGYRVADNLAMCGRLTAAIDIPAVVMTYVTIPDARGFAAFASEAADAGLAGAILPDLPAAEAGPWLEAARAHDLATIFLASSVTTDERLDDIAAVSTGFLYAASLLGVTGVRDTVADASGLVARVRAATDLPVCVGIGVSDREQAASVGAYADGVIVGSAIVRAAGDGEPAGAPERVAALVRELRAGVDSAAR